MPRSADNPTWTPFAGGDVVLVACGAANLNDPQAIEWQRLGKPSIVGSQLYVPLSEDDSHAHSFSAADLTDKARARGSLRYNKWIRTPLPKPPIGTLGLLAMGGTLWLRAGSESQPDAYAYWDAPSHTLVEGTWVFEPYSICFAPMSVNLLILHRAFSGPTVNTQVYSFMIFVKSAGAMKYCAMRSKEARLGFEPAYIMAARRYKRYCEPFDPNA